MILAQEALKSLHSRFLDSIKEGGSDFDSQLEEWNEVVQNVRTGISEGALDPNLADCAVKVGSNIVTFSETFLSLKNDGLKSLDSWREEVNAILSEDNRARSRPSARTTRKRDWRPPSPSPTAPSSPSSSPSSDTSSPNHTSTSTILPATAPSSANPSEHLRLWFLNHLANPYPTPEEKQSLSELTGIARTKIDSDMTNWRRRAGWTEIKDKFAKGDKGKMGDLIGKVQSGKEKRKEIRDAVEKMKAYLERREEERVGDWVYSLTALAKETRKKPRIEGKVEKPMTPPPSAKHTPASSLSGLGCNVVPWTADSSPLTSVRSASSSSSISSISSINGSQFKPYSYDGSFASGSGSIAPALIAGTKRSSDDGEEKPKTRVKLEQAATTVTQSDPQWITGGYDAAYTTVPVQPAEQPSSSGIWTTDATMTMLPHMTAPPPSATFEMPQQWEFTFTQPH